jgi:hypothetical protein
MSISSVAEKIKPAVILKLRRGYEEGVDGDIGLSCLQREARA